VREEKEKTQELPPTGETSLKWGFLPPLKRRLKIKFKPKPRIKGDTMNEKAKDLSLLLMYLTGWEEENKNKPGAKVFKTWSGYLIEIVGELQQQRLIFQWPGNKLIIMTDAGKKKAEELKQKYLSVFEEGRV